MAALELTQAELKAAFRWFAPPSSAMLCKPPLHACAATTRRKKRRVAKAGLTAMPMARCSAKKSRHSTAWAFMCPVAKRRTLQRVDERHSRACGGCARNHHGGAHTCERQKRSPRRTRREKSIGVGRSVCGGCQPRLHHRWRTSGGCLGVWHGHGASGRQNHRPRQRLCGCCQAPRVWHGGHRHDCRAQ